MLWEYDMGSKYTLNRRFVVEYILTTFNKGNWEKLYILLKC